MLDPERQFKYGNSYNVEFPDFPSIADKPKSITIRQSMGAHDLFELEFQYFSTFLVKSMVTGTPVKITVKTDKIVQDYYAYVNYVSYPTKQILNRNLVVHAIGASYVLKEKFSKIWTNVTASQVVQNIGSKYTLKTDVTDSKVKFNQLSMAGHSAWEKINELAQRSGYAFQVVGSTLYFHPIDKMIDKFIKSVPVLAFRDPFFNQQSQVFVQTLDSFESKLGDYVESVANNRSTKIVSGVDPVTSKQYKEKSSPNAIGQDIRTTTKDPLFSHIESGIVANSSDMAKSLADAKANLSRLNIPGTGDAQGDPRIFPWATVEVRGTGAQSDGYWIIKTANHRIQLNGKYTVEFSCVTDGTGANIGSATRPTSAEPVSLVDLASAIQTGAQTQSLPTTLSSAAAMISQTSAGFNITPRRWVN